MICASLSQMGHFLTATPWLFGNKILSLLRHSQPYLLFLTDASIVSFTGVATDSNCLGHLSSVRFVIDSFTLVPEPFFFLAERCFERQENKAISSEKPMAEVYQATVFDCFNYCVYSAWKLGVFAMREGAINKSICRMNAGRLFTTRRRQLVKRTQWSETEGITTRKRRSSRPMTMISTIGQALMDIAQVLLHFLY